METTHPSFARMGTRQFTLSIDLHSAMVGEKAEDMRTKSLQPFFAITVGLVIFGPAQALIRESDKQLLIPAQNHTTVPAELVGKWRVDRELPTSNITCWDEKQAHALIGTEIEYGKDSLRWTKIEVKVQSVKTETLHAEQFLREYSGSGGGVRFSDLGIVTSTTRLVEIQHSDRVWKDVKGDEHYEIPGDWAIMRDPRTIVISVCSVYFEAKRARPR
jgi:hypothetical protein